MATKTAHSGTELPTVRIRPSKATPGSGPQHAGPDVSSEDVWRVLAKASFAVIGDVTPEGQPRSSGVLYRTIGRRLYVAVSSDSWKARHISITGRVAVTVPVRRGGLLSLALPIPPATISFHGAATVLPAASAAARALDRELGAMLPAEARAASVIIEIVPEGAFVTYGLGVSLAKMREPKSARAHVPIGLPSGNRLPAELTTAGARGAGP
jgi:hypothetical protein